MLAKTSHAVIRVGSRAMLDGHTQHPWVHRPTPIHGRWTTSYPH